MTEDRKEITVEELAARVINNPDLPGVQVSGVVTIFDKDGKIKAELPITSIEVNQEPPNAN